MRRMFADWCSSHANATASGDWLSSAATSSRTPDWSGLKQGVRVCRPAAPFLICREECDGKVDVRSPSMTVDASNSAPD